MEELKIRKPEQIRQDCARKVLAVIHGAKLLAVFGYLVREFWAMPEIADLRLASEGRLVACLAGEEDFRIDLGARKGLIRAIHCIARTAALDGDEMGHLLAQVAQVKREQ